MRRNLLRRPLRVFEFFVSGVGLLILLPILILLLILGWFDTGAPLFRQTRIGYKQKQFTLFKIRTMRVGTPQKGSHLINQNSKTKLGKFLRKTKLDEIPQLWNVFIGDMSFVGPRPCLPNQNELIKEREKLGVFNSYPGITGFAQINRIDMSTPKLLAKIDAKMIDEMNLYQYFRCLSLTLLGSGFGDNK